MKKYILSFLIFVSCSSNNLAQSTISYWDLEVISLSLRITYYYDSYRSDYLNTSRALATLQARYDYYYGMISDAWGRVQNFRLVNTSNNYKLERKNIDITNFVNSNHGLRYVDWAANGDYAISTANWMTDIFNDSSIKAEIKLLKAISRELLRLKSNYPDDYYKRERYFEIGKVLRLLESSYPSEISDLAMTYGLF